MSSPATGSTQFDYLRSINAEYIEELFERYLANPSSIDDSWRYFFEGIELGRSETGAGTTSPGGANGSTNGVYANGAHSAPSTATGSVTGIDTAVSAKEIKVAELVLAYRTYGKAGAKVNPLMDAPTSVPELDLARFGLSSADLSRAFQAGNLVGLGAAPLSAIIEKLTATYCGDVAVELIHIENREEREWVQSRIENGALTAPLDTKIRKHILARLIQSESLERFLGQRYVGEKRFSIEGGEASVPGIDALVDTCAELGATDFVMGMAHRGRLNMLVNTFGKPVEALFTEFEGTYKVDTSISEGDVKYHIGASTDTKTLSGKPVHLSLAFNPSHLEFVNPVVEGMVRAKQARALTTNGEADRSRVVPVLIHGDAAFAGQGVCYETVQMATLRGYSTGGTVHVIINNQVGFTTDPSDARSSRYSSDLMRMIDAPIWHVNGDKPEALWRVMRMAGEFRQKFKKDVMIDVVCYRKHGHNEGDEPAFTQPVLYKNIRAHASPREVYAQALDQAGVVSAAETAALVDAEMKRLSDAQAVIKEKPRQPEISIFEGAWKGLRRPKDADELTAPVNTQLPKAKIVELAQKINTIPKDFALNPKLGRIFEARLKGITDGVGIDWASGEALGYASLLDEGSPVRISGQDVERGTFTHRHIVLNDFETGRKYTPHNQMRAGQALATVYNSHLSETAVLGFEYGYALADPASLVVWEAQFGDFGNGAQVIIDQFIATSESKWQRMTGLCLFLPHGYEGQGPEHSSARLERFLQLCGRGNMQIVNLTTPAQIFHAIRRQVKRPFRKPLVLMSPKSMLRLPAAVSTLAEFTDKPFQEVLDDPTFTSAAAASGAERVVLCTGKVYYDLVNERANLKLEGKVAIVRVEQLYPWPADMLASLLARYSKAKTHVWCQEEPRNMGAWMHVFGFWTGALTTDQKPFSAKVSGAGALKYAGRDVCSSPAVGSKKVHSVEQAALLKAALT